MNYLRYIQPIVEKEPQEQEEQDPLEEPLQWQCEDDRATRDDRAIPGAKYPLGQCQNNGGCPDPWGWYK